MTDTAGNTVSKNATPNPSVGMQLLLLLDIWIRLVLWAVALAVTLCCLSRTNFVRELSWDRLSTFGGAWSFASTITYFILIFNVAYLLALSLLRLPLPRPQRGVHRMTASGKRNIAIAGLLAVLTKARHHPPFPAFFVGQLASIVPFRWILGATMGPRTESSFFLDPLILDPWGVKLGKNVTLGFGAVISCHLQEQDYILMDEVVIEDDVSIGAYSGVGCGAHIKRGAIVQPYSAVKPGTVIGEYEVWGGLPAYHKETLKPPK